jgi:hypothetical protein
LQLLSISSLAKLPCIDELDYDAASVLTVIGF